VTEQSDADECPKCGCPHRCAEGLNNKYRIGLEQIVNSDYPAEALNAETWAAEILNDPHCVDWDSGE
jgi:hypothetical protein